MAEAATNGAGWRGRALSLLGGLVSVAAIVFVAQELLRPEAVQYLQLNRAAAWGAVATFGLGYGLLSAIIGLAWVLLVRAFDTSINFAQAFAVHAVSQVLKYLPLNIFHQAGRVLMMKQRGARVAISAAAAVAEAGLVSAAAISIALVLGFDGQLFGGLLRVAPAILVLGALAIATVLLVGFLAFRDKLRDLASKIRHASGAWAFGGAAAFSLYLIFFGLYGLFSVWTAQLVAPDLPPVQAHHVVAALAGAWVAGFLMPGAVAGLGVREAIAVLALGPTIGDGPAVIIAVASRSISLIGDCAFALAGVALLKEADKRARAS